MRHTLLTLAACTVSTLAMSGAAQADTLGNGPFTGPYIGVQAGYTTSEDDVGGTDLDVDGGNYGIYGGFQADTLLDNTVNRLGIGLTGAIEAHYNWSDADDEVAGIMLEKNYDWGVSFRPGLTIIDKALPVDWSPYGILGYRRAEYEASIGGASEDEQFDGFELGLGTQLIAYDNIGVRAEYSHTWYEEKNGIDPAEHNFRIGTSYHF